MSVSRIALDSDSTPTETITIFIPTYLEYCEDSKYYDPEKMEASKDIKLSEDGTPVLSPHRLRHEMWRGVDADLLATIVNNALKVNPFMQIGLSKDESFEIAEQHTWSHDYSGHIALQVKVKFSDIAGRMSEKEFYQGQLLNFSRKDAFFYLKQGTQIPAENFIFIHLPKHTHCDFLRGSRPVANTSNHETLTNEVKEEIKKALKSEPIDPSAIEKIQKLFSRNNSVALPKTSEEKSTQVVVTLAHQNLSMFAQNNTQGDVQISFDVPSFLANKY